ncbi:hypothetical protein ACUX0V_24560 [Salmonella enterica]
MEAINNYNSGLNRHQLGGFIPVYDQLAGTHYFLIDGNRLGFMFMALLQIVGGDKLIIPFC